MTGNKISKIATGVGNSGTPSGLAKISAFVNNPDKNNIAANVYGGDLQGNLWRFDINTNTKIKLASLTSGGVAQPITTTPELGIISKKRVIFVGTGKYLELSDLVTNQVQTVYAIKDDNVTAEITNLRSPSVLTERTLVVGGNTRAVNDNAKPDFKTGMGWFLDFPAGERVNIDPLLVNGVLLMPTTVPSSTSCLGGGYGWFNYFNYKTGGSANVPGNLVSEKLNTPPVGFNITYKDGKPVISVVESNDPTPHQIVQKNVAANSGAARSTVFQQYDDGSYGKRSIWRELIK
jgi:type IV pilus assembly protein PilY1